jgi:phenylalanyl-tRNA synthetase beta chain
VVEALAAEHLPTRKPVTLRSERAARVLGVTLPGERIESMLRSLGLAVERVAEGFRVTPPSFRFDIEIEEDLIEEIARLHGYDNIPSLPPVARLAMMPASESRKSAMALRRQVAARDYHEVVTYSFVEAAWETDFAANAAPVVLANPIASQMGVMRSSLIGGLVGTLAANRKRQIERVRVFEIGRCFRRDAESGPVDGFAQPLRLGALAAGAALPEQWGTATRRVDFFDLKADVEDLFAPRRLEFVKAAHPALHPGRCAEIRLDGAAVGLIGELHPRWVQKYELGTAPVLFEIELPALLSTPFPAYAEVSRLPAVVRDLALVVPQTQSPGSLAGGTEGCGACHREAMWLYSMCIRARASPMAKKALPSG